jgi:glycosyltransferase involved in cell wall biosynthesis
MGNTGNNGEKKSQKIIFVIRYFHPYIGGLEKQTLRLAQALIQRGMCVEVVTSRFFSDWQKQEMINGVSVHRLASPRIKVLGALIFLISLSFYLVKNRSRCEMIHAFQVGYSSAVAIFWGTIFSMQTILNLAGSGRGGDIRRHKMTPWGRIFLFLCGYASRIVVLNQEMLQELQTISYHSLQAVYIPNGVDLTVFKPAADRELLRKQLQIFGDKIVLYTGRLSREKGLDFLIRAFASLSTAVPAQLYVIGNGRELSRLQRLIRMYNAEQRIRLLPAVQEVTAYLQVADIFVMPSLYEGLSNSILEAMACGIPVIATRVSGNAEVIEDGVTGILVDRTDYHNLSQALTELLEHPEKAHVLGLRAQQLVHAKYDLETVSQQYLNVYNRLQ